MPKYKMVSIMERKKKRRGKQERNAGRKNKLGEEKESRERTRLTRNHNTA